MILKRFFDPKAFIKLKEEFTFLINSIKANKDELSITLGNNHIALYFHGISFVKIEFSIFGEYEVMIPKSLFPDSLRDNKQFNFRESASNYFAELNVPLLQELLNESGLEQFKEKIKPSSLPETILFPHKLIQANKNRNDFIILDRFVTDGDLKGKRMDMIAVSKNNDMYSLTILQSCLSTEGGTESASAGKLQNFMQNVKRHVEDYKINFKENYKQRYELGLYDSSFPNTIDINNKILGILLFPTNITPSKSLSTNYPDLKILSLSSNFKI